MLKTILAYLVLSSLAIGVVRRYLALNKLWIRRHERAVAESISIAALLLALATGAPFLAKNVLRNDLKGTANELMWTASNAFMLLIGVGLWVPGQRATLGAKLVRALRLERREARDLLRSLGKPRGAEQIVKILHHVASIDDQLDAREAAYIEGFAGAWGVDYRATLADKPARGDHVALRQGVVDYLALGPPPEQLKRLRRVIEALTHVDEQMAPDEELALSELFGLIDQRLGAERPARHHVAIVPQSPDQEGAIGDLVPGARRASHSGGTVFLVSSHFSEPYAEMMCKKYRSLGLLTLVLAEAPEPSPAA